MRKRSGTRRKDRFNPTSRIPPKEIEETEIAPDVKVSTATKEQILRYEAEKETEEYRERWIWEKIQRKEIVKMAFMIGSILGMIIGIILGGILI